ncbi:MAG: isochorismatase family protein [Candidatus Acidiferrales bacterium]
MPITKLDPNAALVLIDLQKGIVGLPTIHPMSEVIARAAQLARAFRERGLAVVLVNVTGMAPGRTEAGRPKFAFPEGWTELVPELEQNPNDYLVSKQRVGAFHGTPLDSYLRERGVTQVLLAGVSTSSGVEATARSAYDLGYHVAFVMDAITDLDADMHRHSVEKTFPKLGETDTTAKVLNLLMQAPAQ